MELILDLDEAIVKLANPQEFARFQVTVAVPDGASPATHDHRLGDVVSARNIGVVSDDGFRVLTARSATDTNAVMLGQFNGNPASADTLFYFTVTDEGLYPIRLTFEQHTGTGAVEFWDADMATGQYIGLNDPLGIEVFHTASATTRPTLSVSADGTSLRVSWTPTAGTQTLLSSGDLSSRRWDPVSQTPLENNGVKSVTIIPAPTTNIFFRVQQQ